MSAMASQITSVSIVCSTVSAGADQRNHQSSASLAFVRGIHRWPVNPPHKWPVTRKMFPLDDVIMLRYCIAHMHCALTNVFGCRQFSTTPSKIFLRDGQPSDRIRVASHFDLTLFPRSSPLGTWWRWNENRFSLTGPLCGEFTGHRWVSITKAGDAELWCFLRYAPERTVEKTIETPVIWDPIPLIMTPLSCNERNREICVTHTYTYMCVYIYIYIYVCVSPGKQEVFFFIPMHIYATPVQDGF